MPRWLVVFDRRIDFTHTKPHEALHIQKRLTLGRYHHTASAKTGILGKRDRRAYKIGVSVVAQKFVDNGKRLVSVGSLQRAPDDHIHVFTGDLGKILVKIEIVTGQKSEANTLQLQNVRLCYLIAVCHIKLVTTLGIGLDLAGSGMRLEIAPHNVALAIDSVGGVTHPLLGLKSRIDKDQRMTALCRLASLLQQYFVIFRHRTVKAPFTLYIGRGIAIFGKHDKIHTPVALIHQAEQIGKTSVHVPFIEGIVGLNDANLHSSLLLYLALEVSKHLVDLLKAGKYVRMALEDLHHLTDLPLVDNTDQHIFIRVGIHSVHLDLSNAVLELAHQFLRQLLGMRSNNVKPIAVFETA